MYCNYCKNKGSKWCTVETWESLLKNYTKDLGIKKEVDINDLDTNISASKSSLSEQIVFTNVWYTPSSYSCWSFWRKAMEGVLYIDFDKKEIHFKAGGKFKLIIKRKKIKELIHTKMPGDISNNWSKVTYIEEDLLIEKEAWFQDKSPSVRGIGNLLGGGENLFQTLFLFFNKV